MNARYYDPQIGQFISPDSEVPDPTSLLAYNRYLYSLGNPLRYNDPTGHDPCDNGSKKCDPLWLEYMRGELACSSGPCGITYEQFLAAKQQYLLYQQTPGSYDTDVHIINGEAQGDVTGAKLRQSYALLYAEYFKKVNSGVDIKLLASTETMLASMAILAGSAKDVVPSGKFRGPSAKNFDWEHIYDRHSDQGSIAQQRTTGTTFEGLSKSQIQARVKSAWSNRELMETQTDLVSGVSRMRYQGVDPGSGQTVEMWYNSATSTVETAYPIIR